MARIFAGNESLVDPEVFDAVKRLSNEFFVFAEFDIDRRNIDWLIIRAANGKGDDGSSAAILTELKRISAPITGTGQSRMARAMRSRRSCGPMPCSGLRIARR